MLEFGLMKGHTGMILWGDAPSLKILHSFIHEVNNDSHCLRDKESFVLSLAYDIRHAYQGDRKKGFRNHGDDDQCLIYGVEQVWPMLLTQVAILRKALGYMPSSKRGQAVMFELEALIEDALRTALPATADHVLDSMDRIAGSPFEQVAEALDSRCRYFMGLKGKQRLAALPAVLHSLDPMYHFWGERVLNPSPGYLPPEVFKNNESELPQESSG